MHSLASQKLKILISEGVVKILNFNNLVLKRIVRRELYEFLSKKRKVLDIGCGTGSQSGLFSKTSYIGIDISPAAIHLAQKHKGYHFSVMDGRVLRFPQQTFDAVLVSGVLHHLSDDNSIKVVSEMKRVLKPRGYALVIEAIAPLLRWNVMGHLVRFLDAGDHIRPPQEYEKILSRYFRITRSYTVLGGVFDYAVFVIIKK